MTRTPVRWWQVLSMVAVALFAFQVAAAPPASQPGAWTKHANLEPAKGATGTCTRDLLRLPRLRLELQLLEPAGHVEEPRGVLRGRRRVLGQPDVHLPHRGGSYPRRRRSSTYLPFHRRRTQPTLKASSSSTTRESVRDWSFVYIPYCTGDIHMGSATKTYSNAGNPNVPATFAIQHRGFDNFMVVLDWITKNFDGPKNILVTGSSAGGYGASANFPWVQTPIECACLRDRRREPGRHHECIRHRQSRSRVLESRSWPPGSSAAIRRRFPVRNSRRCGHRLPHVKVSQFTTNLDNVQILFYGVMKQFYGRAVRARAPPPTGISRCSVPWGPTPRTSATTGTTGRRHVPHHHAQPALLHRSIGWDSLCRLGRRDAAEPRRYRRRRRGAWQDAACPTCLTALTCP